MLPDRQDPVPRVVWVPYGRFPGWLDRFGASHGPVDWLWEVSTVAGSAADGTRLSAEIPFPPLSDPSVPGLIDHLGRPRQVGVLLVRRGGFAVARLNGDAEVAAKVGRRHVQGRSKAGGWSQQRFARRRDNQAKAAYDAAAEHCARILAPVAERLELLACGGDRTGVTATLAHRELSTLRQCPQRWLGGIPDPNRRVLDQAIERVRSVRVAFTDPAPG